VVGAERVLGAVSCWMTMDGVPISLADPVSLVEAFVSSMTPRVRAITYEVTSNKVRRINGAMTRKARIRKLDAAL